MLNAIPLILAALMAVGIIHRHHEIQGKENQ
jgi:hypothetical protein